MATEQNSIQLARDGVVTRRNCHRIGFDRVLRGAYGAKPADAGQGEWAARRYVWRQKVKAVVALYVGKQIYLYGPTALQMLGVQLPERLQDWSRVHILVDDPSRRPKRTDVVAHCDRLVHEPWRIVEGALLLHPVDHWLQMTNATLNEMVEIGDGFVRRRSPLLTLEQMGDRLDQLSGARGVRLARRAFKLVRPGTDSIWETRTRMVMVDAGLPAPAVNPPVWCPLIGATYHVDMGYVESKTGVEFDGLGHVGDAAQMRIDVDRRRDLQDAGWLIISVTAAGLRQPQDFLRSVENALIMRTGR